MERPLISPAKLDRLRRVDERAMPSRCRVLRRTDVVVGGRVTPGDEAQVGPTVDCRLSDARLRPREQEAVGRIGDETYGEIALPLGTAVASDDRIEVTTGAIVETFEVAGDPWPGSYSTSLTVMVQRED
jgi:hypothetical protein